MKNKKKILLPINFNENTISTFKTASGIAKSLNGEITLVYCMDEFIDNYFVDNDIPLLPITHSGYPALINRANMANETLQKLNELEEFKNIDRKKVIADPLHFTFDQDIAKIAEEGDFDLIIVGEAGGNREHFNVHEISKQTSVPIVSLPEGHISRKNGLKEALVPIDLNAVDSKFINRLSEFIDARALKAHFIYINTPENFMSSLEIEKQCEFLKKKFQLDYARFSSICEYNVLDGIIEELKEKEYNVIAMSTNGYTGLNALFHSSDTAKVLNTVSIPVYVYNIKQNASQEESVRYTTNAVRGLMG